MIKISKLKQALVALLFTIPVALPASAEIVSFDIKLSFGAGLTDSQKSIFQQAEAFWESVIVGYANPITFLPQLVISASGESIDGAGGILGSAGPNSAAYGGGVLYAVNGGMRFDSADLTAMESRGTLLSVIMHEMAHVIGFGTLWGYNGLYNTGTGQYTGENALAAYRKEFDPNATYVPVELDGGTGTANAHWDETWSGPRSDLMTGYLEGVTTLSRTTIEAMKDLGYVVIGVPTPMALSLVGFLLLGLSSRRREKLVS